MAKLKSKSSSSQVLKGQKALVTGANSGIGKSIAIELGNAGADVVVNYVVGDDIAQQVADEIQKAGSQSYIHKTDISKEDQVQQMFETMREKFGTIDILINNAGIQRDSPIERMTLQQWNAVIDVNLTGQFLCAREAIREFKRRGLNKETSRSVGKIVFISSVHEVIPWAGHVNYAASKGGVCLLMKSIAQEVAEMGIRVMSVCPGAIRTPINTAVWNTAESYDQLMTLIPYKRIGEPEDVGKAVVWLASDQADYITGVSLFVDGGMTLYPGFESGG